MNNICLAPAPGGYQISVDSWITSTIALPGLWMGVDWTKKCDGSMRNSGNETDESNTKKVSDHAIARAEKC